MTGKEKCELLKSIRREIAERNGIEYLSAECHHEGDCLGTCPKCDAEARFLNSELERRSREGYSVDFVGRIPEMYDRIIEVGLERTETTSQVYDEQKSDDHEYKYNPPSSMGCLTVESILSKERNDFEKLDLSVRACNCLKRAGIKSVLDILMLSSEKLMKVRNLDKKSFNEVVEKMQSLGFDLSDDEEY